MSDSLYSLTSGSVESTFEEAVASVQNYGFPQSVFEVERLSAPKGHSVGEKPTGEFLVLRPSMTPSEYAQMKPGDSVQCLGLRKEPSGSFALCRIRRMAEGMGRNNMTERK